jgi:hypothetical protein
MRVGLEPERIAAGVVLLLVGALAAAAGVLGIALSPILAFADPATQRELMTSMLRTVVALWGSAITSIVLASFTIAGRHSRAALAIATALVLAWFVALGVDRVSTTWPLLGVAATTAGALLIGILPTAPALIRRTTPRAIARRASSFTGSEYRRSIANIPKPFGGTDERYEQSCRRDRR